MGYSIIRVKFESEYVYTDKFSIEHVKLVHGDNKFEGSLKLDYLTLKEHIDVSLPPERIEPPSLDIEIISFSPYPDTGIVFPKKYIVYLFKTDFPEVLHTVTEKLLGNIR